MNKYIVSPRVKNTYDQLLAHAAIKKALDFIKTDHEKTIEDQITITEIPAPPFQEQVRAEYFLQRLRDLHLENVMMDKEGNVYGVRPGTGNGPTIFISAHLDTVFPAGTDVTVKKRSGLLFAPGIGDDTRGLAELLSIIRACNEVNLQNKGDIIFGATVGEEGAGDLRGVKSFFKEHQDIDGFLTIDGPRADQIIYLGTGSFRYEVTYRGPGGHSYGAFGIPSPVHALGRAIADIADLKTKEEPKTTFTVGEIQGGTSVNAIAFEASMKVDLRSNDQDELDTLDTQFLNIVKQAKEEENKRWNSKILTVDIDRFGDRPTASQSSKEVIVQTAWASIQALGGSPALSRPSSTDANYPMSLGIPSLALARGGRGGKIHTLEEWFDPNNAYLGVQKSFLTLIGLIGVDAIAELLLDNKTTED